MASIKAFMSNGWAADTRRHPLFPGAVSAEWALREAERILAETEPAPGYYAQPASQERIHGRLSTHRGIREALAEALAAFVEV